MLPALKSIFLVVLCIGICSAVKNRCPEACKCTKGEDRSGMEMIELNCLRRNITELPHTNSWPEDVTIADFDSNRIQDIRDIELPPGNSLAILRLSNNWISTITGSSFKSLEDLEQLYLNHNRLQSLHVETFAGLEILQLLDLSSNDIRAFPTNIMSKLYGLDELRVSDNPLKVLDSHVFGYLESLSILEAKGIGCKSLDDNVFHKLQYLHTVDLSRNKFEKIPSHPLSLLHKNPKYGLKYLTMNSNPIKALDSQSFKGLNTLVSLSLCDMPDLTTIKANTFSNLKNLVTLKIASNPKLTQIDPKAFQGMFSSDPNQAINLQDVHFNGNSLSTMDKKMLPWSRLQTIDLQQNSWKCDCNIKWFSELRDVMQSNEIQTEWTCSSPKNMTKKKISDLEPESYVCSPMMSSMPPRHRSSSSVALIWGLTTTFVAVICLSIIIFIIRKRSPYKFTKDQRSGVIRYRKAHTQPDNMEPVEL